MFWRHPQSGRTGLYSSILLPELDKRISFPEGAIEAGPSGTVRIRTVHISSRPASKLGSGQFSWLSVAPQLLTL